MHLEPGPRRRGHPLVRGGVVQGSVRARFSRWRRRHYAIGRIRGDATGPAVSRAWSHHAGGGSVAGPDRSRGARVAHHGSPVRRYRARCRLRQQFGIPRQLSGFDAPVAPRLPRNGGTQGVRAVVAGRLPSRGYAATVGARCPCPRPAGRGQSCSQGRVALWSAGVVATPDRSSVGALRNRVTASPWPGRNGRCTRHGCEAARSACGSGCFRTARAT